MKKVIVLIVILISVVCLKQVLPHNGILTAISSLSVKKTSSANIASVSKNAKTNTIKKTGKSTENQAVTTQNIPVLMYHKLTTNPKKVNPLVILKSTFSAQMRYLKTHGYSAISLDQLLNYVSKGSPLPKKPVVLTFDDGYVSNYTIAYPIMKANNQVATVFMIASDIDSYYDSLTSKDLRIMDANNFRVENHTYKHENLGKLSYASQLATIIKAKQKLQKVLGRQEVYLAYPDGGYNSNTKKACQAAGVKMGLSTNNGLPTRKSDLFTIGRIYVNATESLSTFAKKL